MRLRLVVLVLTGSALCACCAQGDEVVYVANQWGSSVSVIDPDSNIVEGVINFEHCRGPAAFAGSCGTGRVAVSPDGQRLYVTIGYPEEYSSGALVVVDVTSRREVTRIAVGNNPNGIVVAPNGATACVTNVNDGTMSIVNTGDTRVVWTVNVGAEPLPLAISPDSMMAYVGDNAARYVARVSLKTGEIVGRIDVGDNAFGNFPAALAIEPDGRRMYVANGGSGSITVVDLQTDSVITTLAADGRDSFPTVLGFLPDGSRGYTVNGYPTTLYEIDTATLTLRNTGLQLSGVGGMAISARRRRAYLSNLQRDLVYAVDLRTDSVIATIPVGHTPIGVALGMRPVIPVTPSEESPTATLPVSSPEAVRSTGGCNIGSGGLESCVLAVLLLVAMVGRSRMLRR